MSRKTIFVSILTVSIAVVTACGALQQLHIESDPTGAEVYLMRRGEYEVRANIDGFGGSFEGDSFEEDFYFLGTTPLDYKFNLSDTESTFFIPGVPAGASVRKHYQEGILRVVMDGYETEERTIQFSDNLLNLVLSLESVLDEVERDSEYSAVEEVDRGRSECN